MTRNAQIMRVSGLELKRPQTECGNTRRGLTHHQGSVDWRAAMQSTEWRPVVGYEGYYEVSSVGGVRSVARVIAVRNQSDRKCPGTVLRASDDSHGYLQVGLYVGSRGRHVKVHRLVAEAFIGPSQPGEEVRHLDGDRRHNDASNLAWGTRAENMQDAVRHGTIHARFRDVTHCIRGHELTEENVYRHGHTRHCRTCKTLRQRRSRAEAHLYSERGPDA